MKAELTAGKESFSSEPAGRAPRSPGEIDTGMTQARTALSRGRVATTAYLLGVPDEDVARVCGAPEAEL